MDKKFGQNQKEQLLFFMKPSLSFTTRVFNIGMEDTQLYLIYDPLVFDIFDIFNIYQPLACTDFETVTFTIMGNYFHPGGQHECELRVPLRRLSPNMFLWEIVRD